MKPKRVSKYSIQITNNSGSDQNYVILCKPPRVTGAMQGEIWSSVLDSAETPNKQQAKFSVYKKLYAVCCNSHGSPADGVALNVRDITLVNLGALSEQGKAFPGSTVSLMVEKNALNFAREVPPSTAWVGAFGVDTRPDFTMEDARENNFMVGLGCSAGIGTARPAALFVPQPNVKYQVEPSRTYFIAYGDYTPGVLIDTTKVVQAVAIDFDRIGSNVELVHNDRGELVIQTP